VSDEQIYFSFSHSSNDRLENKKSGVRPSLEDAEIIPFEPEQSLVPAEGEGWALVLFDCFVEILFSHRNLHHHALLLLVL